MRLQLLTPPVWTATGTLASGAATVSSLAGIAPAPFPDVALTPFVGQPVSGTGVPDGTTVLSIQSSTALTLSANATATGSETLTFGVEPITLAQAKKWARIEYVDNDTIVTDLIEATRDVIETRLKQSLITRTFRAYFPGFSEGGGYYNRNIRKLWMDSGGTIDASYYTCMIPNSCGSINLPMGPIQSVSAVKYVDFAGATQTVDPTTYKVIKGVPGGVELLWNRMWPPTASGTDNVYVDYIAGYGPTAANIPKGIQVAMEYMIYELHENPQPMLSGRYTIVPDVVERLLAPFDPGIYA